MKLFCISSNGSDHALSSGVSLSQVSVSTTKSMFRFVSCLFSNYSLFLIECMLIVAMQNVLTCSWS